MGARTDGTVPRRAADRLKVHRPTQKVGGSNPFERHLRAYFAPSVHAGEFRNLAPVPNRTRGLNVTEERISRRVRRQKRRVRPTFGTQPGPAYLCQRPQLMIPALSWGMDNTPIRQPGHSDRMWTTQELCALLGITYETLRTWRKQGLGPPGAWRVGRTLRWPEAEIAAWYAQGFTQRAP